MMHAWPQAELLFLNDWPAWSPTHVLEEYDGPQIVLHQRNKRDFLGIAVDRDARVTRWLFSPVSAVEFRGLIHRGETLRSALLKEIVYVVDYASDTQDITQVSKIEGDAIPESTLPAPEALMPSYLKRLFPLTAEQRERPFFDLQSASGPSLPFGDISAIIAEMQTMWATIARSMNISAGMLAATHGGAGSLRVFVDAPPEQFEKIQAVYREIALALGNSTLLAKQIKAHNKIPIAAFAKYLGVIKKHGVEVLAQSEQQAAFLGPDAAARAVETVVPEAVAMTRPPEVDSAPQTDTRQLHGYFENFWRGKKSGKFQFFDLLTSKTYEGRVSRALIATLRPDEFAMVLGRVTLKRYYARVQVTLIPPDKETYLLEDYQPVTPLTVT